MKKWIKKLLSDSKNLPSVRLHLSVGCFFLFCYAVIVNKSEGVLSTIALSMSAMCGVSAFEKGGKNETSNDNSTDGESQD